MTTDETAAATTARTQRANQLAEDCADLIKDLTDRMCEMNLELGMAPVELKGLILEHIGEDATELRLMLYRVWCDLFPVAALRERGQTPMRQLIGRLFDEAPKLEDATGKPVAQQAPALPECMVVLKSGSQMSGALSVTPEDTLRIMTRNEMQTPSGPKPVMVEQFFDADDVAMIAVPREMPKIAGPRIIMGGS